MQRLRGDPSRQARPAPGVSRQGSVGRLRSAPALPSVLTLLQRSAGNDAVQRTLRAAAPVGLWRCGPEPCDCPAGLLAAYSKGLAVSSPSDPAEREAERVADEVMRMPVGAQLDAGPTVAVDRLLARAIDPRDAVDSLPPEDLPDQALVEEAAPSGEVARVADDRSGSVAGRHGLSTAIHDAALGGQPIKPGARRFMEARFGRDLGEVRIHSDAGAGELARQVHARAFTTGNHVFFAAGEYQPDQTSGRRLLAHELTHVLQQAGDDDHPGRAWPVGRLLARAGSGSLNCPRYAGYDTSKDLATYNCSGLAHRTYDFKGLADTRALLAAGTSVSPSTPCDRVGAVKHWLWEYDIHLEDAAGNRLNADNHDFHTVGGPTDGDPLPKDSDEYFTKNGARKVYGPGTAPTFKPVVRDQARTNDPADRPVTDSAGRPVFKVRSNMTEFCACLPCPPKGP